MTGLLLGLLSIVVLLLPAIWHRAAIAPRVSREKREIHGVLRILDWLNSAYCGLWHQLPIEKSAPLPRSGPAILISNHTCGIDHMLLQAKSDRLLGFMIAREYYEWKSIHWICRFIGCIAVNRDGRDFTAIRTALRAIKSGRVLPIFPEGHIVPESGRRLDEMKPGTAYLAVHAQVPVIPAFIFGTPATDEIVDSLFDPFASEGDFRPPYRPVRHPQAKGR